MNRFFINIVSAVVLVVLPQFVSSIKACSCYPIPSPYEAYQEAGAVFVGKVLSSNDVPYSEQGRDKAYTVRERHFRFAIEESFKGIKTSEVEVNAGRIDSSCYSGFAVGESYLVYAFGEPEAALRSEMCSRTRNLVWAFDDIHYIRDLLSGIPEPRVYGSVGRADNDLIKSNSILVTPLEGIKIVVEGKGLRFETVTDKQGLYSIAQVPDGKYKIRPTLPDKYMHYFPGEVEFILGTKEQQEAPFVHQGRTAYAGFNVGWNNRISGKILDAEGNLIKRAKAAVLLARPAPDSLLMITEDHFDYHSDGKYEFYGLMPGKYLLSLTIRAPFKSSSMLTRFYYPGALNPTQAREIVIGESDSLTDRDIKLPPEYIMRQIEGVLVWPDGTPVAENGWVSLTNSENEGYEDEMYDTGPTDKQGRFSAQGFVGAEYWLHASASTSGMKFSSGKKLLESGIVSLKGKPIKVTVGKVNEPLSIIIPLPEGVEKSPP